MTVREELDRLEERLRKEVAFGLAPSDVAFNLYDIAAWLLERQPTAGLRDSAVIPVQKGRP